MDSIKEEREEYDECDIKEEVEIIEQIDFEDSSITWGSPPKHIMFVKDSAKCGEVMVASEGTLTFVCAICSKPFSELHSFGSHIRELHMKIVLNDEILTPETTLDPLSAQTYNETTKEITIADNGHCGASSVSIIKHGVQFVSDGETQDERDNDFQLCDLPEEVSSSVECTLKTMETDAKSTSTDTGSFCVYCGRLYKTRRSFMSHLRKEHSNQAPVECNKADDKTPIISKQLSMTCKYCDQTFDDTCSFRAHLRTHTGPRRFVCPYCPKTFVSTYNRKVHINTHTGERPYKCTHCPKGFSDATNLEMHIRMHLRILKYSCDYCGKRFVQSTEKKLHERTHTGEKPFQCEECGKRYISHVKLTEHGRRHKNIKNYKCEVCDKAFYNSSLLKDHMPTHTGERPFHCGICGQTFPRRKSLRAHEQLHSSEKKYVCDTCGKAFAQCAGLYSHRKSHGEKPR